MAPSLNKLLLLNKLSFLRAPPEFARASAERCDGTGICATAGRRHSECSRNAPSDRGQVAASVWILGFPGCLDCAPVPLFKRSKSKVGQLAKAGDVAGLIAVITGPHSALERADAVHELPRFSEKVEAGHRDAALAALTSALQDPMPRFDVPRSSQWANFAGRTRSSAS